MKSKKVLCLIVLTLCSFLLFSEQGYAEVFDWPVPGYTTLTTTYYYSNGNPHSCRYWCDGKPAGIDIAVPSGTQIKAPADGVVQSLANLGNTSFGKYFEIKHDDGNITLYAHLSEFKVYNGQRVYRGDVIALSGSTGNSTGPHLHFEMSNYDTYRYYFDSNYPEPDTTINPGLRMLNTTKYAKAFTLTSGRYTGVYTNSNLTTRISANAWTGENDEDWITGVGKNSNGVLYARISYPVGSSRQTAYVNLHDVFVPGNVNEEPKTAVAKSKALYKRKNSGQNSDYWIDAGDTVYLLTKDDGWYQVMYPITGYSYWRIAWLPESEYNRIMPSPVTIKYIFKNGTVGTSYSDWVSASNGTYPYTWTKANGSLPPGLSLSSSGTTATLSGTPTQAGTYNFALKVTDKNGNTAINLFTIIIEPKTLAISYTFKNGTIGTSYSDYVTVSGGISPYTWKKSSGSFPPGLSLTYSGTRATLSGIPTKAGTYTFSLKVTDSNGTTATKSFTINIEPKVLSISYTFKGGTVGTSYSDYVTVSGGTSPYTWKKISGDLPPGLSLTSSGTRATLSGTPTKAGTYNFALKVTDSSGGTGTKSFSIVIKPVMYIDYTFRYGTVGVSYSDWVTVRNGTSPYTWKKLSGSVPPGLRLTYSGTRATLSGTPTKVGTYTFTLKVTDSKGSSDTKSFSIVIEPKLYISWTFKNSTEGASYSDYVTVSGGTSPYTWKKSSGSLPPGLKLTYSGTRATLSGTPTKAGTYTFTLKVTDKYGYIITKTFTIVIQPKLYISWTFRNGSGNTPYSDWVSVGGGTSPYTWKKSSGSLPPGLSLTYSGTRATLSGTPTNAGTYTFTLKVTDKNGYKTTKTFTIVIEPKIIISYTFRNGIAGASYSDYVSVSGGTSPYTWKKSSGSFPTGLKLTYSGTKATLSGKPTKAGTYIFTLKVTDKNGVSESKAFMVIVTKTTINGTLTAGMRGVSYTGMLIAMGGTSPYKWTISKGSLPRGLKINASTGRITGTPTKAGTFSFTVKVKDKNGISVTKAYTVKITEASSKTSPPERATTKTTTPPVESLSETDTVNTPSVAVPVPGEDQTETLTELQNNGTAGFAVALNVASEDIVASHDGKDSDLVTVKADNALRFILGNLSADVSAITVYVDDNAVEGVIVEDNSFTLPAEMVHDDFKVGVKAQSGDIELESEELYIISE